MSDLPRIIFIDRDTANSVLDLAECIDAVQSAFEAHALGKCLEPGLTHVATDRGEFHIKTGGLRSTRSFFTCKIGGGFFNNTRDFGWPNIIGLLALFDADNGAPLAIIESGAITRARTAAATAVAARFLARPQSSVITICGAGVQAAAQLEALSMVLPIRRAFIWSRSGALALASEMSEKLGIPVEAVDDLTKATLQSDVIVTCTSSRKWLIRRDGVVPGTFIAAVGADSPDKQELEPRLVANASVVCDLASQCARVGELHHAIKEGLITAGQIRGELGAVVIGRSKGRESDDEIIIFDSTGTAMQDAAAAVLVYHRALASGKGQLNSLY